MKNSFFETELHNWLIRDKMDIELSWFCPFSDEQIKSFPAIEKGMKQNNQV